jgi:hypothetical protein
MMTVLCYFCLFIGFLLHHYVCILVVLYFIISIYSSQRLMIPIISCNAMTNRNRKQIYNCRQNTTQNIKDSATRTQLTKRGCTQVLRYTFPASQATPAVFFNLVNNPVINDQRGMDGNVITTNRTCSFSFVTQIFSNN